MKFEYESENLIYRILGRDSADATLDFYTKNRASFEPFDPVHSEKFYSIEYQKSLLQLEQQQFLRGTGARFWVYQKNQPDIICGCVSFSNIIRGCYAKTDIGYRVAITNQCQGIATKAVSFCTNLMFTEGRIHRIEAYIHKDNLASIAVAKKCGFIYEGTAISYAKLANGWADLERYILLAPFPRD